MTYRGKVWLVMVLGCIAFWCFVIASVIILAKWAGLL